MRSTKPKETFGRYLQRRVKNGYLAKQLESALTPSTKPKTPAPKRVPAKPGKQAPSYGKPGETLMDRLKREGLIPNNVSSYNKRGRK